MVWLKNHPGRTVTEGNIAELFATACGKAAMTGNAVNAFRKCGISPFNPHIFTDADFSAAAVTDVPWEGDDNPVMTTVAAEAAEPPASTESMTTVAEDAAVSLTTVAAYNVKARCNRWIAVGIRRPKE